MIVEIFTTVATDRFALPSSGLIIKATPPVLGYEKS